MGHSGLEAQPSRSALGNIVFLFCALKDFGNLWSCSSEKWAETSFTAWTLFPIPWKSSGQDTKSPGPNAPSRLYPFSFRKFRPKVFRNSGLWKPFHPETFLNSTEEFCFISFLIVAVLQEAVPPPPPPDFFTSVRHQLIKMLVTLVIWVVLPECLGSRPFLHSCACWPPGQSTEGRLGRMLHQWLLPLRLSQF